MNYSKIFSRAEYQLKENRRRQNRKPTALPDEEHLEKLRLYLINEIDEAIKHPGPLTKQGSKLRAISRHGRSKFGRGE